MYNEQCTMNKREADVALAEKKRILDPLMGQGYQNPDEGRSLPVVSWSPPWRGRGPGVG